MDKCFSSAPLMMAAASDFAATLQAGCQPQNILRREAIGRFDRGETGPALGERAGLIHHQRVGPLQNLYALRRS